MNGVQKKNQFEAMKKGIFTAFSKVRDELDDHLEGINRNSDETQSLYEYLLALEQKMDKLIERVDEVSAVISKPSIGNLTLRQQEVFLALYMAELPVSSVKIADQLGFTKKVVDEHIDALIMKGVPLLKESSQGTLYYAMELGFKAEQTKHNVVPIDPRISEELSVSKYISE